MEWDIKLHAEHGYAEIITHGGIDQESSFQMAKAISSTLSQCHVQKVLIDQRNLETVSGSPIDVYERPKEWKAMGVTFSIKIAEVIRPEDVEHFKFLEVVCKNRGFDFSFFFEKEKAIEWLLQ
jgi:hypothetical protein